MRSVRDWRQWAIVGEKDRIDYLIRKIRYMNNKYLREWNLVMYRI